MLCGREPPGRPVIEYRARGPLVRHLTTVIVYIDLEHERYRQDPARRAQSLASRLEVKYRLEDLAGEACLLVRYPHASPALLRDVHARAVFVSDCSTDFEHYAEADLAGPRAIYREAAWPVLGFCAGCQLMAQTYGAPIGPLGPLAADVNGTARGEGAVGMANESGFMPVRVSKPHPLLAGLGLEPVVFQEHYWEVKALPEGFEAHAASRLCRLQVITDDRRRLYGTQFHPEAYDSEHPAGRRLLQNFLKLAGLGGASAFEGAGQHAADEVAAQEQEEQQRDGYGEQRGRHL